MGLNITPTLNILGERSVELALANGGLGKLSHIALGRGQYHPTGTETALVDEVARAQIETVTPQDNHVEITATVTAPVDFIIGEVGFLFEDGTPFAVWSEDTARQYPDLDLGTGEQIVENGVPQTRAGRPLASVAAGTEIPFRYIIDIGVYGPDKITVVARPLNEAYGLLDARTRGLERAVLQHPRDFGAVGDGVTDDTTALEQFLTEIGTKDLGTVSVSGKFAISRPLVLDGRNGGQTHNINGWLKLICLNDMDVPLTIKDCPDGEWDYIEVRGTGSGSSFASLGCVAGVQVKNSPRHRIRRIKGQNFAFAAVVDYQGAGENSNMSVIDMIEGHDCGSGHGRRAELAGFGLHGAFSLISKDGVAGSAGQTEVIQVDTPPPAFIADGRFGPIGDAPYCVYIRGHRHFIRAWDAGTNRLTVYPWLDTSDADLTFEYSFGGGLYQHGSDANCCQFGTINTSRCGNAFSNAALYGPVTGVIVSQFCGSALLNGQDPEASGYGGTFRLYCEANVEDVVYLANQGPTAYNHVDADYNIDPAKVVTLAPRDGANNLSPLYSGIGAGRLSLAGRFHAAEKLPSNADDTASTVHVEINRPDQVLPLYGNNHTVQLKTLPEALNRLFGYDTLRIVATGTGANAAPTGAIAVKAPTGWTVRGGFSQESFGGFDGPVEIVCRYRIASKTVHVDLISGKGRGVDVSYATVNATINPVTSAPNILHAAELTADVTLTLDTVGAVRGQTLRITRHSAGAFNLDVGGLKSLATNQWADVTFNGTAWYLSAAGAL